MPPLLLTASPGAKNINPTGVNSEVGFEVSSMAGEEEEEEEEVMFLREGRSAAEDGPAVEA